MALNGSFNTNSTSYNGYAQYAIVTWERTSYDAVNQTSTIKYKAELDRGYATIHGAAFTINGSETVQIGNVNVSAPGNSQYSRKVILEGTIVLKHTNGDCSFTIGFTCHIAASNLTATGNSQYALDKIGWLVVFNANGGSGALASMLKKLNINLTLNGSIPTKQNYKFIGWNTQADGKGTTYNQGGVFTENKAVTLYAMWEIAANCKIKVNGVYKAGMMYIKQNGIYKTGTVKVKSNGAYKSGGLK